MCKYPITVIKSQIYILLPKPYSLMWHLVSGNRVRNDRNRRPQTRRMRSPKVALLKISMDSVQYNAEHCGINDGTDDEHSVLARCSRNRLSSRSPLCWFNEYVHVRVVILQRSAYGIFKKCKFLWTSFACFGLSSAAISYTISTYEVLH